MSNRRYTPEFKDEAVRHIFPATEWWSRPRR